MNKSNQILMVNESKTVVKYTNYYDFTFKSAISNITGYYINNRSSRVLRIEKIYITWPVGNDALFNVFWKGVAIYSDEHLNSPSTLDSWVNTPDKREIGKLVGTSWALEFFWGTNAESTGYTVEVTFDNGQTIYIAH